MTKIRRIKNLYYLFVLLIPITLFATGGHKSIKHLQKSEKRVLSLPDSAFKELQPPHVLNNFVYIQLAKEGWTDQEIITLMDNFVKKNKKKERGNLGYGMYAKQWKPYIGTITGDSIHGYIDTTYNEKIMQSVRKQLASTNAGDTYYPRKLYSVLPRKSGQRDKGNFRQATQMPAGGRIHWIAVDPNNADIIMVIPDGDAIWRTEDMGKHWRCITDKIPNRYSRSASAAYSLPVDPDDFNHVFAFMQSDGNRVYETTDAGENWTLIPGSNFRSFKHGYCFKNARGDFKFIGSEPNEWKSKLWISEDLCKTWTEIVIPEELKDIHPNTGTAGAWIQDITFDPSNRNILYVPFPRGILKITDKSVTTDGKYKLERMKFKVYHPDGTLRSDTTTFPFMSTAQSFLNIDPNDPNKMWMATSIRDPLNSALFYSIDKGITWTTLKDSKVSIGSGNMFGREAPGPWLGGFGVNYTNPNMVYGCTMNSAISSDGGTTFNEYAWGRRMSGYYPVIDGTDIDKLTYNSNLETVSCARHNADNHCIVSHKSGRVFRGSDGGMLMRDPAINGGDWVNISGNMGQMLYYHMGVNEFGDQVMCSNTQDVDVQTYRYGRWGDYRGYEGSTVFIGPYGGTCYYPSGGSGIAGQSYSSWIPGWTAANVCTGNWFLRRGGAIDGFNFYIIKDFGGTSIPINLPENKTVDAFALARDTERGTLYVRLNNKKLYKSLDEGETFAEIATVGDASIAVNPNNSQELYYASNNDGIKKSTDGGRTWSDITYNQTRMTAHNLYYHEGSGDLYLINANNGIFILKAGTTTWELWMKGYNPAAFSNAIINYTTQEMVLYDYGRGAYIADLEHPSDRYFKAGFKLKELSHINNKRTIGIDTRWTIPLFYNYEWTINGVKIDNPYQYLVSDKLKMGDKVQLKLTMRESPDVTTLSEEFIVAQTTQEIYTSQKGYALSGSGRIDLGHVDYFHNDFTIDFWANVETNGVLLANRQKEERGAKGWYVEVLNGKLNFLYAPANMFNKPKDEEGSAQAATLSADFPMKVWNHIAITHERNGDIKIYINGILKDTQKRILPEHTLNNSIYLSLFSDGFEKEILNASADELKIWNKALSLGDIRKSMYTTEPITAAQLIYHNDFNSGKLETQKERFSKQGMQSRIRAKVQFSANPIPVAAAYAAYDTLSVSEKEWTNNGLKLLKIKAKSNEYKPAIAVYGYLNAIIKDGSEKLDEKYHQIAPLSYFLQTFDIADTNKDTIDIHFFMEDAQSYSGARLYLLNPNGSKRIWTYYANLKYNAGDKYLSLQNVRASELSGMQLAIVKMKPAIELSISSIDKTGYLNLYHSGLQTLQIQATLQDNTTEPSKGYKVTSNNKFVNVSDPFHFTKGKATSNLVISNDSLGTFGDIHTITLTGEDDTMTPFTFDIVNKTTPKQAGNAISFDAGGALVGTSVDYNPINLSNTITLMGWVKIDNASVLSGVKPLLFFRGGGASFGIHLDSGNIRCHWNEESWSWNERTSLTIKSTDIGRWMHVALVSTPTSISYYLNGQRHTVNRDMSVTRVLSPLMLGKNTTSDDSFKGCFDQVSVWSRSLSDDEILKYMHQEVTLDSEGLVSYTDMDYHDSSNIMRDRVTNSPINFTGTYTKEYPSQIPYNMFGQIKRNVTENPDTIGYPKLLTTTLKDSYYTTRFYAYPANYSNPNFAKDKPLIKSFWALTYNNPQAITLGEQTSILFNDPAILSGDSLVMAIRPLGSLEVFQKRIGTKSTKNGEAIFKLLSNDIAAPCELMLFAAPISSARPIKVNLSAETENENIILKDIDEYTLVKVTSISGNEDDTILLTVKEPYASLKKDTICFSPEGYSTHALYIDKTKINAFANNPVTISAIGAEGNVLTLNVSLEPKVSIKLKNGDSDTHIIATSTIANLEIETKLEQGVFTDKILLDVVADMDYSSSINGGEILSNNDVKSGVLDYFRSSQGVSEEGWNLVANPYLANVNLTKEENITGKGITRFTYRYDEKLHNYLTNDRMNYEAEQTLSPLQPYFVQATETNANVTIHPFAKELTLNKNNINFIAPKERTEFRMDLYAKGVKSDRTDIILEAGSQAGFAINEDAPKLWSLDNSASQLYSLIGNKAYSINAMPTEQEEIAIGFVAGAAGDYSLKVSNVKGLKNSDEIILQDKANYDFLWVLDPTSSYDFSVETAGKIEDRFVLKIAKTTTDINKQSACRIYVDNKISYIENLPHGSLVQFYDVQGHLLINTQPKESNYSVPLSNGVYLIKITTNGKEMTAKISVR